MSIKFSLTKLMQHYFMHGETICVQVKIDGFDPEKFRKANSKQTEQRPSLLVLQQTQNR